MQVRITGVSVEVIKPGPKGYSKATVQYTFRGEPRSQNLMSFANPAVFKTVSEWENNLPTDEVEVTVGKNDKGYNEWRAVSALSAGSSPATSNATGTVANSTRVSGSNYETKEERAARQVLIVKQSSLSSAVEALGPKKDAKEYIAVAQEFTDWVFNNEPKQEDDHDDIPY